MEGREFESPPTVRDLDRKKLRGKAERGAVDVITKRNKKRPRQWRHSSREAADLWYVAARVTGVRKEEQWGQSGQFSK
jgi:hypothetical protein